MRRLLALVLAALLLAAAARAEEALPSIANAIEAGLAQVTEQATRPGGRVGRELDSVRSFYEARGFAPAWTDAAGLTARGRLVLATLQAAAGEGLRPQDYFVDTLEGYDGATTVGELAALDIGLSIALLNYAVDVQVGRVEDPGADPHTRIERRTVDRQAVLTEAALAPDLQRWLASLPPQTDRYARLRSHLAELRAVAARGGWTPVPDAVVLKPGMDDPAVAALRVRLVESGDLPFGAAGGTLYDPVLEAGVRRFQARHGLDADGVVGKGTLRALNTPVERRIDQLVVNMERRRYLPTDLGARHVFVNIADFEVKLVETAADGTERTVLTSPVVVGTPYTQTPVFADSISYVVVNPYWHVPRGIATKELLPQIRKHPDYLRRNHYTLLAADGRVVDPRSVDWAKVTPGRFPYSVRQEPGDDNALGRLKIMFPNEFNVYLHDTPSKGLFARAERAFSHGCIRVGRPFELAAALLAPQGIDLPALEARTAGPGNQTITLKQPVPIYVTYLTAFVNKDGTVNFRDDIYGRDAPLLASLEGG
ncbi:MAG: L,D-transpeptidase family protein [Geminicoccaceae bacterium]